MQKFISANKGNFGLCKTLGQKLHTRTFKLSRDFTCLFIFKSFAEIKKTTLNKGD